MTDPVKVIDLKTSARAKILVAEDEKDIASLIEDWLSEVYDVSSWRYIALKIPILNFPPLREIGLLRIRKKIIVKVIWKITIEAMN
jgi:hypothetical protein